MLGQISILILVVFTVPIFAAFDYCSIKSCDGKEHTMCLHKLPKPAAKCNKVLAYGLTEKERNLLLKTHNDLRQKVAKGEEKRGAPGPQPAAKHISILVWDAELAIIAQRWAFQCNFQHDKCRDVSRFEVGQNLGFEGTTGKLDNITVATVAKKWYEEVKDFDSNEVMKFKKSTSKTGAKIGHYTQFVWGNTSKLGCGKTIYIDGGFNKLYVACNYAPSGNWINAAVYEIKGTQDDTYY